MDSPSLRKHRKKWEKKSTLPTQALSCSGSKGLSQPDLLASLAKLPVQKQMQTPLVRFLCQSLDSKGKLDIQEHEEKELLLLRLTY